MSEEESLGSSLDVPELIPIEDYDPKKAKLEASISWILTKAFGKQIPPHLVNSFFDDPQGAKYLKPEVVNVLVSGEVYCKAASNIFRDDILPSKGHQSIIQALSRRGIYVLDARESAVTEAVLMQVSPFKESSHIALIDGLMTAHVANVVTVERVVQAVKKFATFNASSELPYDTEDSLLFWLNKVCSSVRRYLDAQQVHLAQRQAFGVPVLDDLCKDCNDGCCLAATLSFYCPTALRLEVLALREAVGIADSLYNLQLVTDFCRTQLPVNVAHLTVNDLFYIASDLKPNFLAFLADIFFLLEVQPAACVRDTSRAFVSSLVYTGMDNSHDTEDHVDLDPAPKPTSKPPVLPISDLTKRSFQINSEVMSTGSIPDLHKAGSSMPSVRQPLLPKRLQQHKDAQNLETERRSQSLTSVEDRVAIQQSLKAWRESQDSESPRVSEPASIRNGSLRTLALPLDESSSSGMLQNVSIDTDVSLDLSDESIDIGDTPRSASTGLRSRATGGVAALQDLFKGPLENDGTELQSISSRASSTIEPLMPAQIKPAKEKSNNHTKEEESGEKDKSPATPSRPQIPKNLSITSEGHEDSSSDEDFQTPSVETVPLPGFPQNNHSPSKSPEKNVEGKQYDAFVVETDDKKFDRSKPVYQSFTLHNQPKTPEAAEAAGIPVVTDANSSVQQSLLQQMRAQRNEDEGPRQRPGSLNIKSAHGNNAKGSPKTSFAQIKKQKENGEVSPSVLFAAQQGAPAKLGSLRDQFQNKQKPAAKKTTFAALPNQTTWRENAVQRNSAERDVTDSNREGEPPAVSAAVQPLASELLDIRMRLEERRRQMEGEKKRKEMQWSKQRQRVGKQAFIQVISKTKDDKEDEEKPLMTKSMDAASLSSSCEPEVMTQSDSQVYADNKVEAPTIDRLSVSEEAHSSAPPPVNKSKERLRSTSPASAGSRDSSPKPKGSYSREAIQTLIEGGRKRWGSDETRERSSSKEKLTAKPSNPAVERSATPNQARSRPGSCGSPAPSLDRDSPALSRSSQESQPAMSSSMENVPYNTSLDKLNCSLSELQGEIMRLSLQKDQLKTLVGSEGERPAQQEERVEPAENGGDDSKFFLYPRGASGGEPDIASSVVSQTAVTSQGPPPALPPASVPHSYSMPPQMHYAHPIPQPHYGQGYPGQYPPYMTSQQPYPHPQQYPMHGQYPPMYQQAQIYQQPYPVMHQWQQQQQQPAMPPQPPPINSSPSHPSFQAPPPPVMSTSDSALLHPAKVPSSPMVASDDATQTTPQSPPYVAPSTPSPGPPPPSSPLAPPREAEVREEEEGDASASTEGFFVCFDSAAPQKAKPQLGKNRRKKTEKKPEVAAPGEAPPPAQTPSREGDALRNPAPRVNISPGVGFVIADEAPTEKVRFCLWKSEVETFKNARLSFFAERDDGNGEKEAEDNGATGEAQSRSGEEEIETGDGKSAGTRGEEVIVRSTQQKRDVECVNCKRRLKEELAEQKKQEEKSKRDAIFQQYLERKAERENSEGDASTGSSSIPRRGKNKGKEKRPRPMSQPPGGYSMPPEFRGKSPAPDTMKGPKGLPLFPGSGLADNDPQNFPYGGLTHRRPPTPDRVRGVDDFGVVSAPGSDYAGPKLFVKPSSKSNRHIIANAISHCCLAGTVNSDVKNRVLDVLNNDAANHFIILFRDAGMQYKSLYTYNIEKEEVLKIIGVGPKQLLPKMLDRFYKYDSGGKSFSHIKSTRHLSAAVDAVTIQDSLWQKKPSAGPVKKACAVQMY
ncbi:hypothetical protein CAPTEDRAFT_228385 [Capitella teleta]|uniref:CKK domain-containing protein n=1 Tax=Capitella teleta TaxID=283909 RepID=R7V6Z8_CAPTE|nr:hypothetical protein CAPTEDRAFT_228385 [Capitella teleta]|eukprot:ELU11545.1 hypothetical protein CAPTEDRAFT_228385 [Capitella teleta]